METLEQSYEICLVFSAGRKKIITVTVERLIPVLRHL